MTRASSTGPETLARRLREARQSLKPPPILNLVEYADDYRRVSPKTSTSPGKWKTAAQPVAYGPFLAVTASDTHTVTVMAGTQVVKTELLICTACYYIHQEPAPILFVQPSQGAAASFSKQRFEPTIEATPELRELVVPNGAGSTITAKDFPGGSLDFVGSNSPTDLASRPKRVILLDEIDKYPASAGAEGDPVKLAEERASTYRAVGRAKFVRTCSPTNEDTSRIGREYKAGDRRKCFVPCPHCGHRQVLTWSQVSWSKDAAGRAMPETAGIACGGCGVVWTEGDRMRALDALVAMPDHGWRQTREFACCGEKQQPEVWDDRGRARCRKCSAGAPYGGHASFHIPKLLSRRHRLADMVKEFDEAQGDPELLRKFVNTCLAELWKPIGQESFANEGLLARAEGYGPDDLPEAIVAITGFCDVQGNRLEVQLVGWGPAEESWPFLYVVIPRDPGQPQAWVELRELLGRTFRTRDGRVLRIGAFGIDTGYHSSQVHAFCRRNRGRRIFPTKGIGGKRALWTGRAGKAKTGDPVFPIGTDAGKDAVMSRLAIQDPGPGYIHFPADDMFGPDYFAQLTASERRVQRKRGGVTVACWEEIPGKRNEALDTMVGALAVRRSLPKAIQRSLEYAVSAAVAPAPRKQKASEGKPAPAPTSADATPAASSPPSSGWLGPIKGWF